MGASDLPKIGVEAVVAGLSAYLGGMASMQKATDAVNKTTDKVASTTQKMDQAQQAATKQANSLTKSLLNQVGINGQAATSIENVVSKIGSIGPVAAVATAAVAAIAVAFVALGMRGAALVGIQQSFDNLTASIGITSDALLNQLNVAAGQTISEFDLMKTANQALAGATGEFGKEFGESLPKLLEVARVQARATGQSVDYLFNSLVTGVKRASPMLIDNTGITLKVGEANQKYAEALGKTAAQLTLNEQKQALLNAVLESGQAAIDANAGVQETAAGRTPAYGGNPLQHP